MSKESYSINHKGGEIFPLVQTGGVFNFIFLIFCFQHVFKWVGEVGFCIFVHQSGIKNFVSLALTKITYIEIPP